MLISHLVTFPVNLTMHPISRYDPTRQTPRAGPLARYFGLTSPSFARNPFPPLPPVLAKASTGRPVRPPALPTAFNPKANS